MEKYVLRNGWRDLKDRFGASKCHKILVYLSEISSNILTALIFAPLLFYLMLIKFFCNFFIKCLFKSLNVVDLSF